MAQDAGIGDKPQVKLKVRSTRALKKYCKKPKCLCCGYDLRGQFMAGIEHCSECGQVCRLEDLSSQIACQKVGYLPVLKEVRLGVTIFFGLPITLLILGLFSIQLIMLTGAPQDRVVFWVFWCSVLIWLAPVAYSTVYAYKAFSSLYGIWLWILSFAYAVLFVMSLMPLVFFGGMLIAQFIHYLEGSEDRSPIFPYLTSAWSYVALLGAVTLIVFNQWWSNRVIVAPCRRRCYELAMKYLDMVDVKAHP